MSRKRVAVLISGRGSNMQALVEAARAEDYAAEIVGVISNRPNAAGLSWAADRGIQTIALDHKAFPSREAFDAELHKALASIQPDIVACAGFMRRMTSDLVSSWVGRMINIHPSLLPMFKGLNTHQRAIDAGVRIAGCTVHLVSEEVDGGLILGQAAVPVKTTDTADLLSERILAVEHQLYPKVLHLFASAQIKVTERGTVTFEADIEDNFRISSQFNALIVPSTG
ncbi:MAG: phosphoribosylglycinamide formyltransferase [Pseudomonadota bacterium]